MKINIISILILALFMQPAYAIMNEKTKKEQITVLQKRIVELKKQVKKAEDDYEDSLGISFAQYMETVRSNEKEMKDKVHTMRAKMDYEEEKFKIKKKFEDLKEKLKSCETKLMILKA